MPLVFQYGSNCDDARLNAPGRLNGDPSVLLYCVGNTSRALHTGQRIRGDARWTL